jgi:hypothetical protein
LAHDIEPLLVCRQMMWGLPMSWWRYLEGAAENLPERFLLM